MSVTYEYTAHFDIINDREEVVYTDRFSWSSLKLTEGPDVVREAFYQLSTEMPHAWIRLKMIKIVKVRRTVIGRHNLSR